MHYKGLRAFIKQNYYYLVRCLETIINQNVYKDLLNCVSVSKVVLKSLMLFTFFFFVERKPIKGTNRFAFYKSCHRLTMPDPYPLKPPVFHTLFRKTAVGYTSVRSFTPFLMFISYLLFVFHFSSSPWSSLFSKSLLVYSSSFLY